MDLARGNRREDIRVVMPGTGGLRADLEWVGSRWSVHVMGATRCVFAFEASGHEIGPLTVNQSLYLATERSTS